MGINERLVLETDFGLLVLPSQEAAHIAFTVMRCAPGLIEQIHEEQFMAGKDTSDGRAVLTDLRVLAVYSREVRRGRDRLAESDAPDS